MSNKYSSQISLADGKWVAKIVRQISSRKQTVSKTSEGFDSEQQAQAWAQKELEGFKEILKVRNTRHANRRAENDKLKSTKVSARSEKKANEE